MIMFGFAVRSPTASAAQTKMMRQNPQCLVSVADVNLALNTYRDRMTAFERDVQSRKDSIVKEYISANGYKQDLLKELQPEFQKTFSVLHDYRQFIARVRQNINVVIEARYGGADLNEKLTRAEPAEAAIYWASILMEEKLNTAFLLLNPERINGAGEKTLFRLHGAVLKYVRIYNAAFREKGVTLHVSGESVGEILGNPTAIPVVPHTLIDNALKYSQRGAEVRVEFVENEYEIELKVTSHGPKIADDEKDKIFALFYRGRSALAQEEEGAGFGLYLAQFVAESVGTRIRVTQSSVRSKFGYLTTFFVRFRRQR
jgi:signal transduction histidine kinase